MDPKTYLRNKIYRDKDKFLCLLLVALEYVSEMFRIKIMNEWMNYEEFLWIKKKSWSLYFVPSKPFVDFCL